jgi:abequosyltransferase
MKPVLSICIPTYNRASFLVMSLQAVCDQISYSISHLIEIIVVNNASTDSTEQVVRLSFEKYKDLDFKYFQRDINIGHDNVYLCTEFAQGDYVLILSDDDVIVKGSIERIIKIIQETPNLKAISLNLCDLSENGVINTDKQQYPIPKIETDSNKSLAFLSSYITFISSVVFKRSLINAETVNRFRGNSTIQSIAFAQAIMSEGIHVHLADAMVAGRVGNAKYNFLKIFTQDFVQYLDFLQEKGVEASVVGKIRRNNYFFTIIPHILVCRLDRSIAENYYFEPDNAYRFVNSAYSKYKIITAFLIYSNIKIVEYIYKALKSMKYLILSLRKNAM